MSETHPNAFLLEANDKRQLAAQLLGEADALEAKAGVEAPAEAEKPAAKPKRVRKPAVAPKPKKNLAKRLLGKK